MVDPSHFAIEAGRRAAPAGDERVDARSDPTFEALTQAAAAVCRAPIAVITVFEAGRRWSTANQALTGVTTVPPDTRFCTCTARGTGPFEVPDACADPRFAASPLVTGGPRIRAYYGLPLRGADGHLLGTLSVADRVPRTLDAAERSALAGLGTVALALFERRRTTDGPAREEAGGQAAVPEALWRELVDELPALVALVDPNGRVTFLSGRSKELAGRETFELLGHRWLEVLEPSARQAVLSALATAAERVERFTLEIPVITGTGATITLLVNGVPRLDAKGDMQGYAVVAVDLTEHEKALRALRRSLDERTKELDALVDELPTFLLAAAHDLRAPLRAVCGYAEMLKGELSKGSLSNADFAVSRILRSATDLDTLVEALLRLTSLSQVPMRFEPMRLERAVTDAWQELQTERTRCDIELVVHPLPLVECDPGLITRAFANLLGNAIKFSALQPTPHIEVGTCSESEDEVVVFVRDNGVGFEPHYAAQLFEPFRRFHKRSDFPGHGMGLAIVSKIVRRHGGRVWATGEPGRGATFYVALPAAAAGR